MTIADQLSQALRLARQYVLYGIKDSTGSIRAIASRHLTLLDAALAAYDAALSAAPEADTILRELVELHRKIGRPGGVGREFSAQHDAAWAAAFAWADAQKAPQPEPTLKDRLQSRCIQWNAYWRAPDAHGVILTLEQATELLVDALGVEVEIEKAPQPRTAEPAPAGCGYPYCGGNAPECKTCGNKRAAPAPADEPPPLRQEDAK
jgi:hypothetical protein